MGHLTCAPWLAEAAGAAGVLDVPLDCANWNTVRTMLPLSSSAEVELSAAAAAESPVAPRRRWLG